MKAETRVFGLCLGLFVSWGLAFGQGLGGAPQEESGEGVVAVKEAFSASLSKPFIIQISLPTGTVLETLRLHGLREGFVRRISSDEELPLLMQGDEVRLVMGSKEGLIAFEGMVMNQEGWSFQKGGMLCIEPSNDGGVVCIPEDAVVEASLLSPKEGPPVAEGPTEDRPLIIEVQGFPVTGAPYITYLVRAGLSEERLEKSNPELDRQLIDAAKAGDLAKVKDLIRAGADVNAKDSARYTPLMFAAQKGHTDIVKALIKAGADVNAIAIGGYTPLMFAAQKGHTDIVKALIKAGANVNAKREGEDQYTPLIYAAENGHTDIVKALIKAGANVNAKTGGGWTALMYAARNNYAEIVKVLIEAHADVNARNVGGYTALALAKQQGNGGIVKLLTDAGAKG